nr:DNA helicase [Tanacetum cinerariifolium]
MLLCHQKGCRSFLEIRTVNNTLYPTNKAAREALGLLGGDQEWIEALQEAKEFATSPELRKLFVQILMFCEVSNPISLWHMFWKDMSDDIPRRLSKTLHLPQIEKTEAKMKAGVLFDLEAMLNSNSKSLKYFGLPMPPQDMLKILQNKLLMEEKKYNPELLAKEKVVLIPKLNTEQKDIFDDIVNAVNNNIQKLIFVYGHGGTGKTFLWKAITCALRSAEKVVLAVASSEGFDMAAYADMPKPVVIAVCSTWATRKYGGLQLTATPATHYYLNLNVPVATYILNVYAEFINPMDALEIQRQPYSEESQEQMRNRYCIETLLNVNPQHYKPAAIHPALDDCRSLATSPKSMPVPFSKPDDTQKIENYPIIDGGKKTIKIKISKKQLEEVLGKTDVQGLTVEQVLAQLMSVSERFETHERSWRPALHSIPE